MLHGGDLIAKALQRQNVKWVFTLCGGHISPILTACRNINIRVIDVRHEATAVFAADSVSRISEPIGVAVVTAGPGLTNTITAIKNAQMAQVAVLILGLTTILADVAIWGSLSVLTITISKEVFLAGSWGYGLMDGLYGVGALISTIAVMYMTQFLGRDRALLLCYLVAGVMCLLVPIAISIYLAGVAYFFMGLHNTAARICIRTIFMEQIPNKIMGRVQTILGVYTRLLVVASALSAGWITENLSVNTGMIFTAIHYLIALMGTILILAVPTYKMIIKQEAAWKKAKFDK